jgi:formate hydrogenlyase subunit 3/multisubunit Na+/H+ antiporter MnhD subunit
MTIEKTRPFGISALTILFVIGTAASFISAASLAFPGSFLEPIWRLNPHAREAFDRLGSPAIVLMIAVCIACICTSVGLWRGTRWGYWLALLMLVSKLAGDLVNVISGTELRAIVGIPIVLFLLGYLVRPQIRKQFH